MRAVYTQISKVRQVPIAGLILGLVGLGRAGETARGDLTLNGCEQCLRTGGERRLGIVTTPEQTAGRESLTH